MNNTCITFRPKMASDLSWVNINTTAGSGCFANNR
jgi:hypothetical protein